MSDDHEEQQSRKQQDEMWQAFLEFDVERDGHIKVSDLKKALELAGEKISDDECYRMISLADPENTGNI